MLPRLRLSRRRVLTRFSAISAVERNLARIQLQRLDERFKSLVGSIIDVDRSLDDDFVALLQQICASLVCRRPDDNVDRLLDAAKAR